MLTRVEKLAFNRGLVSRFGLARADIKRLAFAASVQKNWIPSVLGSMRFRPGLGFLGSTHDEQIPFYVPFVFAIGDAALVEFTDSIMRVWVDDEVIEREAVTAAVTNGNFDANVTNWTDNDEAGGTSVWVTGGYLGLTGNGTAAAIRDQSVTVNETGTEHALRIVIQRGPVVLRVGSTTGGEDYVAETELQTGAHSLAFTPTGNFSIRFLSRLARQVLVDSVNVEASGIMTLPAPYTADDLSHLRYDQSGDVIFLANAGYTQRRIERRATRSWSLVQYLPEDGPFMAENVGPITMTPTALSGNAGLNSSVAFFKSTHAPSGNNAGALFIVHSLGQSVTASITAENQFTDAIEVTNVENARIFTVFVDEDAAGAATFTLQRSLVSSTGPWTDVQQWTADAGLNFDDGLDNQIVWYRLGVKTGDYVNGTHTVSLEFPLGSIAGICRVTGINSATQAAIEIIKPFGGLTASPDWAEGAWSDRRGWPTAVVLHEGRLAWAGKDKWQLSISDTFDGFDPEFEGDAGTIQRSIGSGPVDHIEWLLSLQRLLTGGQAAEFSVRSSSLDEILTPTNFNAKRSSTQGSANVQAVEVDQSGVMVQRGGARVYQLALGDVDYEASDLSALIPDIGSPGITRIAVQRQPDTRLHFRRTDGTVAMLVFDKVEQVICWLEIDTDGAIVDVVIRPGEPGEKEDRVYYAVQREVDGTTKCFLERWAFEAETGDVELNKMADSFVTYSGVAATSIPAAHLEGRSVVVWADGEDVGTIEPHLRLSGTANDYASTPDSALLHITDAIDIRIRYALDDWTPASITYLASKYTTTGASVGSWLIGVVSGSTGRLQFEWVDSTGTLKSSGASTDAPTVTDGEPLWLRYTNEDNGAGGRSTKFYSSADYDPDTREGTWTQIGDTKTTVATVGIQAGTEVLTIDGFGHTSAGKCYRLQVFDGIEGTLVADFDPRRAEFGASSFEAVTGETWTVNGEAELTDQKYVVASGVVTLETAAEKVVVGLAYDGPWQSAKLVELMSQPGGSLTDTQKVNAMGLIVADTHHLGLKFGQSLVRREMDDLPQTLEGAPVPEGTIHEELALERLPFPGKWTTDARLCLRARAPRPATVLAALAEVEHHG